MNRFHLFPKLVFLLAYLLSFLTMSAQSGRLEYWFDGFENDPQHVTLSGATTKAHIDVRSLSQGPHQLYMRVRLSDGNYSPIYQSLFFKFKSFMGSSLEYWFDENLNLHSVQDLVPNMEEGQTFSFDLSDQSKFPLGFHILNMRVVCDGGFSSIYSAPVFKLPCGNGAEIQYWLDDDYQHPTTRSINVNSSGYNVLKLDLSNPSKSPLGIHKLNMRILMNGGRYSPIYSDYIMILAPGFKSELVYWLDDDYKGRAVLEGGFYKGLSMISKKIDFSNAPIGAHRLKLRISTQGFDDGVIYEVPIVITKRYNKQDNIIVVGESHWNDAVETNPYSALMYPAQTVTLQYNLDPNDYEVGQHAFYVQFKNSAEVWSEANATYFYKDENSRLRAGIRPDEVTGIDEEVLSDDVFCSYVDGTIYLDCHSPKLDDSGIVIVSDLTGKVVAKQTIRYADGIHAEINVDGFASRTLIIRMMSGSINFVKKIMIR